MAGTWVGRADLGMGADAGPGLAGIRGCALAAIVALGAIGGRPVTTGAGDAGVASAWVFVVALWADTAWQWRGRTTPGTPSPSSSSNSERNRRAARASLHPSAMVLSTTGRSSLLRTALRIRVRKVQCA